MRLLSTIGSIIFLFTIIQAGLNLNPIIPVEKDSDFVEFGSAVIMKNKLWLDYMTGVTVAELENDSCCHSLWREYDKSVLIKKHNKPQSPSFLSPLFLDRPPPVYDGKL